METNKIPITLIYTGDCNDLAILFEIEKNRRKYVYVNSFDLEKRGTNERMSDNIYNQSWDNHPVEFRCNNPPIGEYYVSEIFGKRAIMKRVDKYTQLKQSISRFFET